MLRAGGGEEAAIKKIREEGIEMNKAKLWAIQISKLAKMKGHLQHRSLFNTMELYSHPELHLGSRSFIWIATVIGNSS